MTCRKKKEILLFRGELVISSLSEYPLI
jgi:hypothetical protein